MGLMALEREARSQTGTVTGGQRSGLRNPGRILTAAVVLLGTTLPASAYDPSIDQNSLKIGLQKYTSCNSDCAKELGGQILNTSVDVGLKAVGAIKANGSTPLIVKYMTFYALLRSAYESGRKVGTDNAACSNKCDDLNKEIVVLGSSGLLGPMLRGDQVDPVYFSNPKVIEAYKKFLKPVQLPAEEKGEAWAKYIASLS